MSEYYTCDVAFIFDLDESKCNHCMSCVDNCSYDALHYENDEFTIDSDKCSRCETCVGVCPAGAIDCSFRFGEMKSVGERVNQEIFIANITKGTTGLP